MSNAAPPADATSPVTPNAIDFDAWRARIKADTFARYHLAMADAMAESDPADAVEACRRAVALLPDMDEAQAKLVGLLRRLDRIPEAEQAHRAAVAVLGPDYESRGWIELGIRQLRDYQPAAGEISLAHGLAAAPGHPRGQAYHALALLCSGRIDEGLATFAAARGRLGPETAAIADDYTQAGNYMYWRDAWREWSMAAATAVAVCAVELSPGDNAKLFTLLYQEILSNHPERVLAHVNQSGLPSAYPQINGLAGWACLLTGGWSDAERILADLVNQQADFTDRGSFNFWVAGLAVALQGLGREAEARALLDAQIDQAPDDFNALRHRGLIALTEGRLDIAGGLLERAAAAGSHSPLYLADVALCHLARGDANHAERLARQALANAGRNSRFVMAGDPWLTLVLVLILKAKGDEATAAALHAAHVAPYPAMKPYFRLLLPNWGRESA